MQQSGDELTLLLRFMAVVKAVLALGALAAVIWRLGHPASAVIALSYAGSTVLMGAAPVLIWQMAHVAGGAALFHLGLLLLVVALFADRGQVQELAKATIRH
ncbi:hypothetical protein [Rhodopseudomonas sp. BAL398]|uniref:hypothetical protein n=1 Tax=Rhodopseudomonas sp. BAL398 TaxID=3034676 RepID=UPI0023E1D106|nr:hypothetical protein [Rhodopseudomonas sp. BAL398]